MTQFDGCVFTFNDNVTVVDDSKFGISDPNNWENNFSKANGNLEYVAEGNQLKIILPSPIVWNYPYAGYFCAYFEEGAIKVGEVENGEFQKEWNIKGESLVFPDKDNFFTEPAFGSGATTTSLQTIKISLSDPKFGDLIIGPGNGYGISNKDGSTDMDFTKMASAVKLYITNEGSGSWWNGIGTDVEVTEVTGLKISGEGRINNSHWYKTLVITLPQIYTEGGKYYTLYLPENMLQVNDEDRSFDDIFNTEAITLPFQVSSVVIFPRKQSTIDYKEWNGVEFKGNGLSVKGNVADILLYPGFYSTKKEIVDSKVEALASGVISSSNSENIVVKFDYDLYDGSYTIYIPNGVINNVKEEIIGFTVTGRPVSIEDYYNNAVPASESKLEQLDRMEFYWGSYTALSLDPSFLDVFPGGESDESWTESTVSGKLSVDGVERDVNFTLNRRPTNDDSETGGGAAGSYEYYLEYTPDSPITVPGIYTFTVPAGSVYVYIKDDNKPLNNEVSATYTIVAPPSMDEPVYTDPKDKSIQQGLSFVRIYWDSEFDFGKDEDGDDIFFKYLDTSDVKVYIDDKEKTDWATGMMADAEIMASNVYESIGDYGNEVEGDHFGMISLTLPDLAFSWRGTVKFVIPAGLVQDKAGNYNPEVVLTYYVYDTNSDLTWLPKDGSQFEQGNATVVASWGTPKLKLNENVEGETFVQLNGEGERISLKDKLSVDGGNLLIDLSSLEEGNYLLCLAGGTVLTNEGEINNEDFYNFSVYVPKYLEDPAINPASGKTMPVMVAQISLAWENKALNLDNLSLNNNKVTDDSFVKQIKIYHDDQEMTEWVKLMGAGLYVNNTKGSNEGELDPDDENLTDDDMKDYTVATVRIDIPDSYANPWFGWTSGSVKIIIPAGMFESTDGEKNQEIEIIYYLEPISPPTVISDPEEGDVNDLDTVTLTWHYDDNDWYVFIDPRNDVYLSYNDGALTKTKFLLSGTNCPGVEEYYTNLTITVNAIQEGEYKITIPAYNIKLFNSETGSIDLEEDIILVYNFKVPVLENIHIEITDHNDQVGEIHEKAETDDHIAINTAGEYGYFRVNAPEGYTVYYKYEEAGKTPVKARAAEEGYQEAEEGNLVKLPQGSGTVSVYAAKENGVRTNTLSYTYAVGPSVPTGVEGILESEEGVYRVYNLNGVLIMETKSASSLNLLGKGLYIINGKVMKK